MTITTPWLGMVKTAFLLHSPQEIKTLLLFFCKPGSINDPAQHLLEALDGCWLSYLMINDGVRPKLC